MKRQEMKKRDHAFRRNKNLQMVRCKDKKQIYFLDTVNEVKMGRVHKTGRKYLGGPKLSLVNDFHVYDHTHTHTKPFGILFKLKLST